MNIKITFSDGTTCPARGVCERQLYLQNDTVKWALDFQVIGAFSSDEVSAILQAENTQQITLTDGSGAKTVSLFGYNKIERAVICYNDLVEPYVDVRLTKLEKGTEVTDDGESGTV